MATEDQPAADPHGVIAGVASQALEAWKRQFDTALRLVEAMTEGAARMHEWRLQAAVDANASATATQLAAAKAGDPATLLGAEARWMQGNVEQAASYWRMLFEMGLETNSNLLKCLLQQSLPGSPGAAIDVDASKNAMLEMVESAYCQWLDASRRFVALAGEKGGA